jgi:hypothetical protein
MIFGLVISTFLTLIIAPAMYYLNERFRDRFRGGRKPKNREDDFEIVTESRPKIITHL